MGVRYTTGQRIEYLREHFTSGSSKKFTQEDLAKAMTLAIGKNISRETIKQWENDERDLKTGAVVALAKYFGVTSDYLLGLSDAKSPDPNIQAICAYTGLSEGAVFILHTLQQYSDPSGTVPIGKQLVQLSSQIVEHKNYFDAIYAIRTAVLCGSCKPVSFDADDKDALTQCLSFLSSHGIEGVPSKEYSESTLNAAPLPMSRIINDIVVTMRKEHEENEGADNGE